MSSTSTCSSNKVLVVLTLKQHEDGIWIRRLVQALKNHHHHHHETTTSKGIIEIQVKSLETWLGQGWIVSSDCGLFENNVVGIVNRVSDAAPPALFKLCCAVLGAAQSLQIPIVNGPTTYALCANKWCHHVLFRQAKLSSPSTIAYYWNGTNTEQPHHHQQHPLEQPSLSLPQNLLREDGDNMLLIKPNAGGFGAGIRRVSSPPETLPRFDDNVTLLQQYVPPRDKKLYRVWFLRGKVQCAVERSIVDESTEFTEACAAGTCSAARPKLEAWKVPEDVQQELEQQLLPLLVDGHCGSVEFLYSEEEQGQQRLYFDLNLLSTLPVKVSDPNNVWSKDYDPWKELAAAVWRIVDQS